MGGGHLRVAIESDLIGCLHLLCVKWPNALHDISWDKLRDESLPRRMGNVRKEKRLEIDIVTGQGTLCIFDTAVLLAYTHAVTCHHLEVDVSANPHRLDVFGIREDGCDLNGTGNREFVIGGGTQEKAGDNGSGVVRVGLNSDPAGTTLVELDVEGVNRRRAEGIGGIRGDAKDSSDRTTEIIRAGEGLLRIC